MMLMVPGGETGLLMGRLLEVSMACRRVCACRQAGMPLMLGRGFMLSIAAQMPGGQLPQGCSPDGAVHGVLMVVM